MFRGHFGTFKSCLERRLGIEIPADHPVSAWLTAHVCLLIITMVRGEDGSTAWAQARGRPFRQSLIGFAESCMYKLPVKGLQHDEQGNMAPRWKSGISLGYNRDSNSYILGTDGGWTTSRAMMRRPLQDRWDARSVESVSVTPSSTTNKVNMDVTFKPLNAEGLEEFPDLPLLITLAAHRPQRACEDLALCFRGQGTHVGLCQGAGGGHATLPAVHQLVDGRPLSFTTDRGDRVILTSNSPALVAKLMQ